MIWAYDFGNGSERRPKELFGNVSGISYVFKLQSDTVIKFQGGSVACPHGPKDPDEPLSQKPEFRSYQGPLS